MFFLCPILYFEERVANSALNLQWGGWIYKIMDLNPMFALSTAYKKVLVAPPTLQANDNVAMPNMTLNWLHVGQAGLISLVILVAGYHMFNSLKWRFVERP